MCKALHANSLIHMAMVYVCVTMCVYVCVPSKPSHWNLPHASCVSPASPPTGMCPPTGTFANVTCCVCSQKAFPHPLQAHQLETASLPTASAPTCCVHPQQAHPLECAHLMEPALCDLCAPSKPATQGIQRQCALQAQWGLAFPQVFTFNGFSKPTGIWNVYKQTNLHTQWNLKTHWNLRLSIARKCQATGNCTT